MLTSGQTSPANNFCVTANPASLSGVVYEDTNQNGLYNPGTDSPIPGTTVTLTGTDIFGNPVNLTQTSDASGAYSFTGLTPSNAAGYKVTETQPAGYLQGLTIPGVALGGINAGTLGGTATLVDMTTAIPVGPGQSGVNYNFGEVLPASLSGFVYVDANNNGVKDSGEAPIPGTTVTLTGSNDQGAISPITTTTDGTGAYNFTSLRPGTYTVTEIQPPTFEQGTNAVGTVNGVTIGQLGPRR